MNHGFASRADLRFVLHNNVTELHGASHEFLRYLDGFTSIQLDTTYMGAHTSRDGHQWDGVKRYVKRPSKMFPYARVPTGLLQRALWAATQYSLTFEVEDRRPKPPTTDPLEEVEIPLRDYQQEASDLGVKIGRGVFVIPPRGGKTRLAMDLCRRVNLPTIWIAPTDRICSQTEKAFAEFFDEGFAVYASGKKKIAQAQDARVLITTMASAALFSDKEWNRRQMLVCDEWHHFAAKTGKIIWDQSSHIYYRYGLTGTHFRSDGVDLPMHALLGNEIYCVESYELLRRALLVPTDAVVLPMNCPRYRRKPGESKKYNQSHGKYGLQEHEYRNDLAANATALCHKAGLKTLVLVNSYKQGSMIYERLEPKIPSVGFGLGPVEYVTGKTDRAKVDKIMKNFNDSDGDVQVLIGTSIIGEGVDLPACQALVYAYGMTAEVSHTQAIYRVCTADGVKKRSIVIDFDDKHQSKLSVHALGRIATYAKDPVFELKHFLDIESFLAWFASNWDLPST